MILTETIKPKVKALLFEASRLADVDRAKLRKLKSFAMGHAIPVELLPDLRAIIERCLLEEHLEGQAQLLAQLIISKHGEPLQ